MRGSTRLHRNVIHNVLHLRHLLGQVLGFLLFALRLYRPLQIERALVGRVLDVLLLEPLARLQAGLEVVLDRAVERSGFLRRLFHSFQSRRLHLDLVLDCVAGRSLFGEAFGLGLLVAAVHNPAQRDLSLAPVLEHFNAAQVVLVQRVVDRLLVVGMSALAAEQGQQPDQQDRSQCQQSNSCRCMLHAFVLSPR